eukprot:GEMP01082829.1.p1 GENE.GEMP01082829.1~~GEMP01082829.1.p1  ORF type:complete len:238 (+),score=42.68 GEMP01082829.1:186-899(+)
MLHLLAMHSSEATALLYCPPGPDDVEMQAVHEEATALLYRPPGQDDLELQAVKSNLSSEYERTCFICLGDEGSSEEGLVPCCTQCYTQVHPRCWRDWRNNQRITVLRSRLLGIRVQKNHMQCSICKTGLARVPGEDISELEWLDRDSDDEASSDDRDELSQFVDVKMCSVRLVVANGFLLILMILFAGVAVCFKHYFAGDVVLFSFIGVYEVGVFQILALMVIHRRRVTANNEVLPI